jgi:3-oxoacyl-[acyl-carrier-protein] synthase II
VAATSRGPLGWWLGEADGGTASATGRALCGLAGTPATLSAIQLGIQGLVTTISNACVGGSQALGLAMDQLRHGHADVMLVAGHDFPLVDGIVSAFEEIGVLAPRTLNPTEAMRPYDHQRSGFVLGEGAVVLCLERVGYADHRGARRYAEVLGQSSLNEAAHPTTMDQTGKRAADLVRRLLDDAGRRADEIGYVCGHGSATTYNDRAECRMLERLLPDVAAHDRPPLGSVKPVFGHTLGASAIVNAAATALMLHHQTLVPTANYRQAADDCPGDHVASGPRSVELRLAVSMSHALGSQSAAVLMGTAPGRR